MPPTFWSGWLEVAVAGLMVAVIVNRRLSAREGAALCATALAEGAPGGGGRAAILRATCAASEAGWARLVRAALREPASGTLIEPEREAGAGESPGYRDAPRRVASGTVTRIYEVERTRIRRERSTGLGGAAAALGGGAMLLAAQPIAMALVMLAAALSGWRVLVNARRAAAALDEAQRALPDLQAILAPPPPPVALVEPAPSRVALQSSAGLLGGILIVGFGLIVVMLGAGVLSELHHRVSAGQIGLLLGVHVIVSPVILALSILLRRVDAAIDAASGELVLVHRVLGRTVERTILPLEIVGSFFVKSGRLKRLAVETANQHHERHRRNGLPREPRPEASVELADGDRVEEAAAALNGALGRTGWKRP